MIYLVFYTALISFFSCPVVAMLQPYKVSSSYLELLAPGKLPANIIENVQEFVSDGNILDFALKNYKWLSLCGITNDRTAQLAQFYPMYPETVLPAYKAKRGCNELPRYSEEGNVEVVRLLVDGGEDISFFDKSNIQKRLSDEKDPAKRKAYTQILEIFKQALIKRHEFLNDVWFNDSNNVLRHIISGVDIDFQYEPLRYTALLLAVSFGYYTSACHLLHHKADPNRASSSGKTPLVAAVDRADKEMVQALLKTGADTEVLVPLYTKKNERTCYLGSYSPFYTPHNEKIKKLVIKKAEKRLALAIQLKREAKLGNLDAVEKILKENFISSTVLRSTWLNAWDKRQFRVMCALENVMDRKTYRSVISDFESRGVSAYDNISFRTEDYILDERQKNIMDAMTAVMREKTYQALAPKLQDIYKAAYGSLPSESGCSLEFLKKIINSGFYELLIAHLEKSYIAAYNYQRFPIDSMIWPFSI